MIGKNSILKKIFILVIPALKLSYIILKKKRLYNLFLQINYIYLHRSTHVSQLTLSRDIINTIQTENKYNFKMKGCFCLIACINKIMNFDLLIEWMHLIFLTNLFLSILYFTLSSFQLTLLKLKIISDFLVFLK